MNTLFLPDKTPSDKVPFNGHLTDKKSTEGAEPRGYFANLKNSIKKGIFLEFLEYLKKGALFTLYTPIKRGQRRIFYHNQNGE